MNWSLFTPFRQGVEHFLSILPYTKIQALDEYTTSVRNRLIQDYGIDISNEREIFAFTAGVLRTLIIAKDTRGLYPDADARLVLETTSRTVGVLIRDLIRDIPGIPGLGDPE